MGRTESNDGDVSENHGGRDFWLAKLDDTGSLQWQRCYGGTGNETANSLLATSDGGFLLLGTTGSLDGDVTCGGPPQLRAWALKVDLDGALQWQTCLIGDPGGSNLGVGCAVETADGGYLVVGGSSANAGVWHENHGQGDFFVVKLDGSGEVQWLHCYGGSGSDVASTVRATPDGNFVVAGITGSTDGQITTGTIGQIWVIKIDPEGNLLWNRRMGGSNGPDLGQEVRDLVVNPDGSILMVGTVGANDGDISGNHGSYDVWLVVLDSSGTILQQRCFGGSGWDNAWGGAATGQGRYVIAGYTDSDDGDVSGNHGGEDAWVLMVDANLDLLWQKCLGGSGADAAFAMARTSYGETIISGHTNSNDGDVSGYHGNDDIWVAKLGSDMEVGMNELRDGDMELSVHPSPASDQVFIKLPEVLPAATTLEAFDVTGRRIMHRPVEPGIRDMRIPVAAWADGIYCLRLNAGAEVRSARFIKR